MSDPPPGSDQPFKPSEPSDPSDPIPAPGHGEPPPGGSGEGDFAYTPSDTPPQMSTMAIVGLVLSLAGFILYSLIGLAGLVVGLLALLQINRQPEKYKGKGFAIAAMVIGAIDLAFGLL